ncbi:hypothetical protein [Ornithinimicrobium avium]|uniref:Uncharacterized protein n=1 Tax=Ornithinimicrobium avium TaxID=2283195 RepID=A0A345NR56_9MICO|nr:hypothetical protein [Ornithinimicrobium avium]AXH97514.1 hypothetical protein DV701_16605 [Ornithinimicrobium avium]
MVDHDDEALNRLRATDPATGSHPDLHTLRRRIAQKAPASQADTATALHDEMFAGPTIRAPWIAAAAVLALGFGAGGYAIGAQQASPAGGTVAAGQGEESASDRGGDSEDPLVGIGGRAVDAGPDSASTTMNADSAAEYAGGDGQAWDPGPVRLVAGAGLPTGHTTGEVRALMSDEDPDAFLTAWAERLSFEGLRPTTPDEQGWFGDDVIYDPDGARILAANVDGTGGALNFNYSDLLADPYCADMYTELPDGEMEQMRKEFTDAFGADVALPDASRCKDVSGPAPSKDDAIAQARDFLATTGLDVSAYELRVPDYQDDSVNQVMVEGWPVDGPRNGQLNVSVTISQQGVTNAYGMLGEMRSLGDYALISATEAVERYGQREFGMEYGITLDEDVESWATDATTMPVEPDFTMPEPLPVEPGMKIPLLLKEKVVTGAELTRGTIWGNTGGPLEVPAWKLTTEDGMHYAVLALADESIDWQSWGD